MRASILSALMVMWFAWPAVVIGEPRSDGIPRNAVCRTCQVRGSAHGEEKVVAWRDHDATRYYFCSEACGEAFDLFPSAYLPKVLPRPAPDAELKTLGGEVRHVSDWRGQVVLVDFWATWCKPCVKALPNVQKLHDDFGGADFTVLGVSIDELEPAAVGEFVKKQKLDYPIALDVATEPAWHAFGVAAVPSMFLIDAQGRIVAEWAGRIDLDRVREAIEASLSGSAGEHAGEGS